MMNHVDDDYNFTVMQLIFIGKRCHSLPPYLWLSSSEQNKSHIWMHLKCFVLTVRVECLQNISFSRYMKIADTDSIHHWLCGCVNVCALVSAFFSASLWYCL